MPLTSVDDVLRDADPDLFGKYGVIKKALQENLQTRWCGRWAEGNDHGPGHIIRVLEYLAAILGQDPIGRGRLNAFELFLAATAVVAHDIGVIDGRDAHAKRSAELLNLLGGTNTFLFDEDSLRVLSAAVACHSSNLDIDVGCRGLSLVETFVGHDVRPRFIAALVRLADELDEDRRRAEKWVQDLVRIPETSRPYWEFCQRVQGIRLDESSVVFNVSFRPEDAGRTVLAGAKGSPEPFLRFFAGKIAKINREREHMRPHLGDLARKRIEVVVSPLRGTSDWTTPREFFFSDGACFSPEAERSAVEHFIRNYPELEHAQPRAPVVSAPDCESNVFVVGPVIEDPRRFFGRASVVRELFRLWKGHPLQNAAIIGPPRSGKTSLLHHLTHLAMSPPDVLRPDQRDQCPPQVCGHRWALVDFQNPRMGAQEGLLRHLLSQLGIRAPEPCTMESFYYAVESGLQTPTVVLLDELGVALTRYPALDDAFWESLRSLALAVHGKLGFVLAAHESPHALAESTGKTSSFFNIFGFTERLGPLTEAEARQIVKSAPIPFPEADVAWIVANTRWPIKVQALCRARLAALEDGEEGDGWRERGLRQMNLWSFLAEEL